MVSSFAVFSLSGGNREDLPFGENSYLLQRAKKVVSDSPGKVDFAIGLMNPVLNLPEGQAMFLGKEL